MLFAGSCELQTTQDLCEGDSQSSLSLINVCIYIYACVDPCVYIHTGLIFKLRHFGADSSGPVAGCSRLKPDLFSDRERTGCSSQLQLVALYFFVSKMEKVIAS